MTLAGIEPATFRFVAQHRGTHITIYYNILLQSYGTTVGMRSVVDRKVVMWRIPVLSPASCLAVPYFSTLSQKKRYNF